MIETMSGNGYIIYYSICWRDRATGEHYSEFPEGRTEYDPSNPNSTGEVEMCFDGLVRKDQTGELFTAARELANSGATYTEVLPEDDPHWIPVWKKPGANDAGYAEGDLVRYGGKIYASEFVGNKYEPGKYGYGWTEVWPWTNGLPWPDDE